MGMNLRWNFALGLRRLHADRILPSATLYRLHLNSPLTAGPAGNFFMKSLKPIVPFFACIAIVAMGVLFSASSETNAPLRIFQFTYLTRIPTLPADAKISRIWIPLPQSDRYQIVSALKIETPFAYTRHRDPEYGNEYLYLEVPAAKVTEPAEVRVSFDVTRYEHRVILEAHPVAGRSGWTSKDLRRYLQPDRRVPLQGVIAELSAQETRGIQDPLAKARA
jgi:hypothetical protein